MSPEQRRQVLAEIAREELKRLVYGEIACEDDRATLAALAEAAGVELAEVLPATGEPGRDLRTGVVNPRAHYDSEVTVYAEDTSGLVTEAPEDAHEEQDEPDGEPEFEAIKAELFSDLAAVLDASAEHVQALLDFSTAEDLEPRLRHALLVSRVRAGHIRRIRGRHAVAA